MADIMLYDNKEKGWWLDGTYKLDGVKYLDSQSKGVEWDIELTEDGDIILDKSPVQTIKILLQWIYDEWRLGPELGFPWYEDVWKKNPDTDLIKQDILNTIYSVEGVTSAKVTLLNFNRRERSINFQFTARVNGEDFTEEVTLHA